MSSFTQRGRISEANYSNYTVCETLCQPKIFLLCNVQSPVLIQQNPKCELHIFARKKTTNYQFYITKLSGISFTIIAWALKLLSYTIPLSLGSMPATPF